MCGICGKLLMKEASGQVDPGLIERMCQALRHRGPDDQDTYINGRIALGHRRLSIIDLSTGRQPICNEDQSIWIVFNGEIYNFVELREQLKARGHQFTTGSDTEVILHLYEDEGTECVTKLRGMFAFAIWDQNRQRLFLARDRFGEKPLLYCERNGEFIFASELRALLQDHSIPRKVEMTALAEYLRFGYVPCPATIFEGVHKLPPAHVMVVEHGQVRLSRYWEPVFTPKLNLSEAEAALGLVERIKQAVAMRLVSDVPLGAYLSGGIDSSIVVGYMCQVSPGRVKTFCMGFGEGSYDERRFARQLAEHWGTDHYEFEQNPDIVELLPKLIRQYGEPYADSSSIPSFCLSEQVGKHVTVALTGDGGDELFAGYIRYAYLLGLPTPTSSARYRYRVLGQRLPRPFWAALRPMSDALLGSAAPNSASGQIRDAVAWLGMGLGDRWLEARDALHGPGSWQLFSSAMRAEVLGQASPTTARLQKLFDRQDLPGLDRLLAAEMDTQLPDDLLVKMDIASMANGIETRAPFLDHELADFANRLPVDLKLREGVTKYLLRKTFASLLPDPLSQRPKQGFSVPIASWLRHELSDCLRDTLTSQATVDRGFYDTANLERTIQEHQSGARDHSRILWRLLMLESWFAAYDQGQARRKQAPSAPL